MTPQQRDAFLAEKLGIDGWKPGAMCKWPITYVPPSRNAHLIRKICMCGACRYVMRDCPDAKAHFHEPPHEIPPPNLRSLEGMAKLLIALQRSGLTIMLDGGVGDVQILDGNNKVLVRNDTDPWSPDLIADAAYEALEQDPK
jgi:hypothetical protein